MTVARQMVQASLQCHDLSLINHKQPARSKSDNSRPTRAFEEGRPQNRLYSTPLPDHNHQCPYCNPSGKPQLKHGIPHPLLGRLRYFSPRSPPSGKLQLTDLDTVGVATRAWQLGIEMRPLFLRQSLWAYPLYAGVGASFGYWLQGIDQKQTAILEERKKSILEKRARRSEKEIGTATGAIQVQQM